MDGAQGQSADTGGERAEAARTAEATNGKNGHELGVLTDGDVLAENGEGDAQGGDAPAGDADKTPLAHEEQESGITRCFKALIPDSAEKVMKKGLRTIGAQQEDWESKPAEDRERWWELHLSIRSLENVTSTKITCFFCVSVQGEDLKRPGGSKVHLATQYSPIVTLAKGQCETPENPIVLYERKNFALSYKELGRHVVKVDMWRVSCWTFNEYHGYQKKKLDYIANSDPNLDLMMKKKLSKAQLAKKKHNQRQQIGDVALFSCRVNLEEIFDFRLLCDNWTLELRPGFKDEKVKSQRKRLTFLMPRDRRSLPGQRTMTGGQSSYTSEWNKDKPTKWFWARCGEYVFRGTRTHLQNTFFIVQVHTGDPATAILEMGEALQKTVPVGKQLGKSLMNLTSVLDISVFKGQVKAWSKERDKYIIGELSGNVKCKLCSKGMHKEESDYNKRRPEQSKSTTTVSHLKSGERHLVVKVRKCENLPVADFEAGSSDPYLRVSWDNMVMQSNVIYHTTRPVFNQNFYFPVRIVYSQVGKPGNEKKYVDNILKFELESKGPIKIEVWDDDVTSADFLGGCVLTLQEILSLRSTEKRSLLGGERKKKEETEEVEHDEGKKTHQWYEHQKPVRLYDTKTPLNQSNLQNNQTAFLHFEAYFYPDWPTSLRLEDGGQEEDTEDVWKEIEVKWKLHNLKFQDDYAMPFPDSIGAKKPVDDSAYGGNETLRRFPCMARHTQKIGGSTCPLMCFLSPIIIPQEFSTPAKLLHWVYCVSFEMSTRQLRTGLIPNDGWKDSEYVLARRKGAAQDHAILLCSLLLGCKKDAYVCKGTVYAEAAVEDSAGKNGGGELKREESLIEHVWVMTREDGWVTFWEPISRQVFHLPNRCQKKKSEISARKARKNRRKKGGTASDGDGADDGVDEFADALVLDEEDEQEETVAASHPWEGETADARISIEDMENLPTVGRQPKPKMRVQGKKKEKEDREALRKKMLAKREALPTAPDKEMLKPKTLVNWLPYDSIDVIFNSKQLWANRQNHHPACITYDLPEGTEEPDLDEQNQPKWKWEPLLQKENCTKHLFSPISPNVSIQPPLRPNIVDDLTSKLREEMMQNLMLYRGKKGYDTFFDTGDELRKQLVHFLQLQEMWLGIDPDSPDVSDLLKDTSIDDSKPEAELKPHQKTRRFIKDTFDVRQWNRHGSPFFGHDDVGEASNKKYEEDQARAWDSFEHEVDGFVKKLDSFPAKRGKRFRGFPAHFSTSDHDSIRTYLMELPLYKEFIDKKKEDLFYTIECKIYALLGGVLSVWLYIGIQETIEEPKDAKDANGTEAPSLTK